MMLAAIKLYVSRTYGRSIPNGMPLLSGIESYYGAQLGKERVIQTLTDVLGSRRKTLMRLLTAALTCAPCAHFLAHLCSHKLRLTALRSIILVLSEESGDKTGLWWGAIFVSPNYGAYLLDMKKWLPAQHSLYF